MIFRKARVSQAIEKTTCNRRWTSLQMPLKKNSHFLKGNLVEIGLEYLNVFSMCLFIEKLLSSSNGALGLNFKRWSFNEFIVAQQSASTPESGPELGKGNTERGVTQSPSSRFSGGGKKNVMKAAAVTYATCCGSSHGGRGILLCCHLHLQTGTGNLEEVNFTWALKNT